MTDLKTTPTLALQTSHTIQNGVHEHGYSRSTHKHSGSNLVNVPASMASSMKKQAPFCTLKWYLNTLQYEMLSIK